MLKKYLQIVVAVLFLCSCTHSNSDDLSFEVLEALPFDGTLQGNPVPIQPGEAELLFPLRILNLNDDYLIISDNKPEDIFLVFRLPELDFLYGWGREGRGPDEFPVTHVLEINQRGSEIILYELMSQYLRFYSVTDTGFVKVEEQLLNYEDQLDPLTHIRRLNDSLYIADYGLSVEGTRYEHIALRPGDDEGLFFFGRYPEVDIDDNVLRYIEFLKRNAAHPDGTRFAVFYIYQNWIKIYDSKGEELKSIRLEDPYVEHEKSLGDKFQYRIQPWATEHYLYTLGWNSTEGTYSENQESIHPSLEVWDWEGRPVYRARFDRPVNGFTVSEKYGKLYAYTLLSSDEIYEYDLPDLLMFDQVDDFVIKRDQGSE